MPATTANSMMLLFSQSLLSSSPSSSGSPATLPSPSPSSPASPSAVAPDSAALAKDCLPCRIVGTLSFTGLGAYTIYSTRQLPKSLHKYTMMSAGAAFIGLGVYRLVIQHDMAYDAQHPLANAAAAADAFRRCDSNETFVESEYSSGDLDNSSNLKAFVNGSHNVKNISSREYAQGTTPLKAVHCPKTITKPADFSPKLWNFIHGPDFQDFVNDERYLYKGAETNVVINGMAQSMKNVFYSKQQRIEGEGKKMYRFFLQILDLRLKTKIEDASFSVQVGESAQSYTTNSCHCRREQNSKYCYASDVNEGFVFDLDKQNFSVKIQLHGRSTEKKPTPFVNPFMRTRQQQLPHQLSFASIMSADEYMAPQNHSLLHKFTRPYLQRHTQEPAPLLGEMSLQLSSHCFSKLTGTYEIKCGKEVVKCRLQMGVLLDDDLDNEKPPVPPKEEQHKMCADGMAGILTIQLRRSNGSTHWKRYWASISGHKTLVLYDCEKDKIPIAAIPLTHISCVKLADFDRCYVENGLELHFYDYALNSCKTAENEWLNKIVHYDEYEDDLVAYVFSDDKAGLDCWKKAFERITCKK